VRWLSWRKPAVSSPPPPIPIADPDPVTVLRIRKALVVLRSESTRQQALTAQKRLPALAAIMARAAAEDRLSAYLANPVEEACRDAVKMLEEKLGRRM
jgi:hypothetical protein